MRVKESSTPELHFSIVGDGRTVTLAPRSLVVAGYTATDPEVTARHIAELAALGVPAPAETPAFYELPPDLLTSGTRIAVERSETSGEVEPVLLCTDQGCFVTVGSDHTARDIERSDIHRSKLACPKVLASEAIEYEEAVEHWGEIVLRSWTGEARQLYQEGRTASLTPIAELLKRLTKRSAVSLDGLVLFLGTVPLASSNFVFSDTYAMQMSLPGGGPVVEVAYEVVVMEEGDAEGTSVRLGDDSSQSVEAAE
jgi:4-hydroxyphenylacetate 3-monooxygenase